MTSMALDMSFDDIIENNRKSSNSRGKPPRSSAGPGLSRRFSSHGGNRTTPYSKPQIQALETTWQHDMFMNSPAASASAYPARASSFETMTKLYISNLDFGVSTEDIKLFSEVGDLKRYSVHYDRSGRSEGTAEIVFARREDAVSAVKRYNNVQLDGKPMKIEIVETNITTRLAVPSSTNGMYRNQNIAAPRSSSQ